MKRIIKRVVLFMLSVMMLSSCKAYDNRYEFPTPVSFDIASTCDDLSLEDIEKLNNGKIEISYMDDSSVIQKINGVYTTKRILTAEDAVASLTSVRSLMNILDFSYSCEQINISNDSILFKLQQLYKGVPVYNGTFEIVASVEGEPLSISGRYISDIKVNTEIYITKRDASKLIVSGSIVKQELMIYKSKSNESLMVWIFLVKDKTTKQTHCIIINALNKVIIDDFICQ